MMKVTRDLRASRRLLIGCLTVLAATIWPAPAKSVVWLAPGEPLQAAHLEALVEPALPAGVTHSLRFTQPALPLANPATSDAQLQLLDLMLDPRTERFNGSMRVRLATGEVRVLALGGNARAMLDVPVPTHTISPGEPLEPSMLEIVALPERQVRADTLLDPSSLIGVEARRRLLPGRPVRRQDVQPMRLVRRGEPVGIVYRMPGMELTITGRALDDGGQGSLVGATNIESGQRLSGVVVGPGKILLDSRRDGWR
jgi:flagella basal body P-ring formation protein FlgA